jgi:hypothetical protein
MTVNNELERMWTEGAVAYPGLTEDNDEKRQLGYSMSRARFVWGTSRIQFRSGTC